MAFDPKTWRIFLPAADIETIPAAKPSERPQRKIREKLLIQTGSMRLDSPAQCVYCWKAALFR
jgi:hypothetical protein